MNLLGPFRFNRAELIFSLKCFAAAMLAMYVASRMGQPRPFWALMTTYVVANPLAGAVRSKGLFRLLGTLLGSAAALLLVPALSNTPELLTLALALWLGVCLYFSLQDRTPRSYVFMLAGYTAALIGFPAVDAPQTMFDTAVARVEEIGLGILAATVVHSIVLPTGLAPTLLGMLDRSLRDARQWLLDLMQPPAREASAAALTADRKRVAADITQLRLLSTHIPFDTTHLRWTAGAVRAVQDRVASLTPALSAVEDRLQALRQAEGELASDVTAVLAKVAHWLQAAEGDSGNDAQALRQSIRDFGKAADTQPSSWSRALRLSLAERLDELVDGWRACIASRQEVDDGLTGTAPPSRRLQTVGDRALHRDVGMALLSSLAAVVAVCICAAFWILTGWPSGSAAAMMAAVFCSFFATMDDPVPAIHGFLKYTLWSVPLSAVYVLLLLPVVHDFGMLVVVCAPVFLLLGCFVARPATMLMAMPILFGVSSALALHDTANADLVSFSNSMIAQVLGILVAARTTRLIRSVGVDWSARRIQRATWRELAEMAAAPRRQVKADAYAVRMLDRISLLAPRVAAAGGAVDGVSADALRDLRLGADVVAMQRVRGHLPVHLAHGLMRDLERLFRERTASKAVANPSSLLKRIDDALQAALGAHDHAMPDGRSAVSALVGLRRNLYPEASPARPALIVAEGGAA
ncbi:FUSC family protein [Variovorax sp. J2P1-59]|uniref:FUSC family protein n=1 Tax=Variovorax flavidus TaxID=3053501 RepID=UPI0025768E19|nr:FUSC family protein [Variovorax sp. J2P1-59]MDM0073389.1 FUSC family protein [Variovorax sp. J2P1-59]